jgi:hypothetical protein
MVQGVERPRGVRERTGARPIRYTWSKFQTIRMIQVMRLLLVFLVHSDSGRAAQVSLLIVRVLWPTKA